MIKEKYLEHCKSYEETTKEMQGLIRKIITKRNNISKLDVDLKMQKHELKTCEKRIDITQKKINVENARLEELESKLQDKFSEFQNLESNESSLRDFSEAKGVAIHKNIESNTTKGA